MLQIDRQDEDQVRRWMADHEDLPEVDGEEDSARDLTFSEAWLPLMISFLNGVVVVNKYVGGLTGLLQKADTALKWLKGARKDSSHLSPGERILTLLLSSGRRKQAGMSVAQIAAITGLSQEEVRSSLTPLKEAAIVALSGDRWYLVLA